MRSADPLLPLADLRNEEIQWTVVTNPYWEKMNASDIAGDGDDDADDGDVLSMEIMMLDGPICENVLQILDMTTPKSKF